jgi:amidase
MGTATHDVLALPAVEQARLVRAGEVSAHELVEAALEAVERLDGELGAFVLIDAERALAEAEGIAAGDERPLAGVPIGLKDLQLSAGLRTTFGSRAAAEFVPEQDAAAVRRLREAGAVAIGKTNAPELGILPVTEPEHHGPARNPWDPTRTPGGSSGGSAVAVAAGMVSLASASDGGGSIRIPASCCGLVGLKPTRGRVSLAPNPDPPLGIINEGVLSRTVADTAAALDVLTGYEPGDPFPAAPPPRPYREAAADHPDRLRIAWSARSPTGVPVDEECETAAQEAAAALEELGHEVAEEAPDWFDPSYIESFVRLWIVDVAAHVHALGWLLGGDVDRESLEPLTRRMVEAADEVSAIDYWLALAQLRLSSRAVLGLWSERDVFVCPTLARPPLELGALRPAPDEDPLTMLSSAGDFVPFTPIFNVTGQPAISLPLHQSAAGLPVGVQLVGRHGEEDVLLSLAAQLEQARPWADRRPAVHAGAA